MRYHKFNPLRNNVTIVRQDCCQPCGLTVDIGDQPLDVEVDNSDIIESLQAQNEILQQTLFEIQNTPQIEGINTRPVCFSDGTSGSVGVMLDEESGVYTTVYFDDQEQQVTGKTIITCPQDPATFLGDPIEVCV